MFGWLFHAASPTIRPAAGTDARFFAALHAEGFDKAWGIGDFEAMIADRSVIGHAIGFGRAAPCGFALSRIAADEAEILSIAIARKQRGKGLSSQLLRHHLSGVIARRAKRMFLEVEAGNQPAIALYRRFGFAEVGRRKSYYRKNDGSSADALIMARDL